MEASMAAQQGAGDGQSDGQAEGQAEQAQGLHAVSDVSGLVEQFAAMQSSQEEMRQILGGLAPGDYAWPEDDGDGDFDLDAFGLEHAGGDPGDVFGPDGDPEAAAQQLGDHLEAVMQHHTEQALAPLRETVSDLQRTMDINQLVLELPELADPQVMSDVLDQARIVVESEGLPLELAARPAFVRLVYAAGLAFAQAAAEDDGEEAESAAHIEGGGGAGPGAGRGTGGFAQQIVQGGRTNPLPFK